MAHDAQPATLPFDPEQVINEWRRFYDWAVLSRQGTDLIEAISCLGQKFSATLGAYRLAKQPHRRAQYLQQLQNAYASMQVFYHYVPATNRLPIQWQRDETGCADETC
jgi:hypothetical protein